MAVLPPYFRPCLLAVIVLAQSFQLPPTSSLLAVYKGRKAPYTGPIFKVPGYNSLSPNLATPNIYRYRNTEGSKGLGIRLDYSTAKTGGGPGGLGTRQ